MKTYIKPYATITDFDIREYMEVPVRTSARGIGLQAGKQSNNDWESDDDESAGGSGLW